MIKNTIALLNLICFLTLTNLFAESSYEIILLAPTEKELSSSYAEKPIFSEAGYVGGTLKVDNNYEEVPFVYDQQKGVRLVKLPEEAIAVKITSINKNGLAVGTYTEYGNPKIFIYDIQQDKHLDLLEHFQWEPHFGSLSSEITSLFISDNDQVVVTFLTDWSLFTSYLFDLQKKTINLCPFIQENVIANSQGQLTGSESYYSETKNSWFFDTNTGYHELGSLDKFNRWKVIPSALSPHGIVAGKGWNSHNDLKGFYWSHALGLQELNLEVEEIESLRITAVSDQGHVIGNFDQYMDENWYYRSFFFDPAKGMISLDSQMNEKETYPRAINNHDQVVGSIEGYKAHSAFIWDAEHGMRLLTTLVPQNTGWKTLEKAYAITDAGWILGKGLYYGVEHSFLLIPRQ